MYVQEKKSALLFAPEDEVQYPLDEIAYTF